MLIKQVHLKKIRTGEISLAFRKWKNKRIKKGSLIKTSIGQIKILDIVEISFEEISQEDAKQAGYDELRELRQILKSKAGNLYKISLQYHAEDTRVALRNKTNLSSEEFEAIHKRLERLDKYSNQGDWTLRILQLIQENPNRRAADLAEMVQMEKQWLKTNIRKLKNLGLTISHEEGYSISPLGKIALKKLSE